MVRKRDGEVVFRVPKFGKRVPLGRMRISYVYSDLVCYQTSDIRLLWTIITKP